MNLTSIIKTAPARHQLNPRELLGLLVRSTFHPRALLYSPPESRPFLIYPETLLAIPAILTDANGFLAILQIVPIEVV